MNGTMPAAPPGRIPALDGLRGAAAFVVVVHHALLTMPGFIAPYHHDTAHLPAPGSAAWWLVWSPLHLVWAGGEAVLVFFVLSGLVLTRPALEGRLRWRSYYPQRAARLYLPVFAAVAFGYLLARLVDHGQDPTSAWIAAHTRFPSWQTLRLDLTLVNGDSLLITPLWSLRWEVWFSLLLPLFVLMALLLRRAGVIPAIGAMAVLVALAGLGVRWQQEATPYLPIFGVGALLAVLAGPLQRRAASLPSWTWPPAAAVAIGLLLNRWVVPGGTGTWPPGLGHALAVAGAGLLVALVLASRGVARPLERPLAQWAGRISFSLYLVHEPVVVAAATIGGPAHLRLSVPAGIVASVLVAVVFYRFVELPLHKVARKLGSAAAPRADARPDRLPV